MIENMDHGSTRHEVLAVVFQIRHFGGDEPLARRAKNLDEPLGRRAEKPDEPLARRAENLDEPELGVLLWQRAQEPQRGAWSLPGGWVRTDEDLSSSVRRQLAEKVDVRELTHLEQLSVFSDPARLPGPRTIASTFLGLMPSPATPVLPADTRWHRVSALPPMAFDHEVMVSHARTRLIAKMSYTNIGFALSPAEFALSTLRDIYCAALGYPVDTTNLQRVLARRRVITPTGTTARSGRSGGRPAALYRFTDDQYRITDEFAALRPPG